MIARVKDKEQRGVLKYRYIDGLRMEEIAERMQISLRHAKRLHSRAIAALDMSPPMC